MSDVTTAEFAAALIALVEGTRLKAYCDSGGILTIGVGSTKGVTPGMVITPEQAAQRFAADQAPLLALVATMPILKASALVSFGFNTGVGKLWKVLEGKDTIDNPVHQTDHHGVVQPGLVGRRHFEALLIRLSDQLEST
jgi:GH24 family phage-related lysozyme (muramidase)